MKKTLCFIIGSLLSAVCAYGATCEVEGIEKGAPALCGGAVQGGMVYGESDGWDVYKEQSANSKERISKDGVFVLGLDRDEPEILKLTFCKSKDCRTYSYKIKQREYIEQKVNVPDKFIEYPDKIQKRIDVENEQIRKARAAAIKDDALDFMGLSLPAGLKKFPISGVFGSRRVFNGTPKSPHKGLDIAAPAGTPAGAVAAGRVVIASDMYLSGKTVFVSHGFGITSAYLHLSEISVKVGDKIKAGDKIGKIGATGRVSGPHLHLGIYWRQTALDPELLLIAD